MKRDFFRSSRLTSASNVLYLYAGRASGVLVAFVFLPLYSRILGPDNFGYVAVVLSLQSLLLLLDFGMSLMVARSSSLGIPGMSGLRQQIRTAELCLTFVYALLLFACVMASYMGGEGRFSLENLVATLVLFWAIIVQNVFFSAQMGLRNYRVATVIQIGGGVLRAGVTIGVINYLEASVRAFILAQMATAVVHLLISRYFLLRVARGEVFELFSRAQLVDCRALFKRGKPLLLSGIAGAAALQLDKPLMSMFVDAAEIAPYFLATVLSSAPASLLAAPIVQFFQPRITQHAAACCGKEVRKEITNMALSLIVVVGVPTTVLISFLDPIIGLWLGSGRGNALVANYSTYLLIGYGISALGYIPYVLIISVEDYTFHGILSTILTVFLLAGVAICAYLGDVELVCNVYLIYFAIGTVALGLRARFIAQRIHC